MALPDPNATNNLIIEPFGTSASNPAYITLPIPVADQTGLAPNKASFATAFPPNSMTANSSGGLPFFGQDLNGLLYMITANVAALAAGALPVFDAARAAAIGGYPQGAIVARASLGGYWMSTSAANSNNPDTGGAGWVSIASTGEVSVPITTGTVTLTAEQAAFPLILFTGTLTGNVTVIFPENLGQSWTVANGTAGAFTVQLQTAAGGGPITLTSGAGYSGAQNVFVGTYLGNSYLFSNNVSTAGLAPLASPALTGTPTAPTGTAGSFTTQIATQQFVANQLFATIYGTYALLASPTFSGVPTVPTPAPGDNSAKIASTAYVLAAITASLGGSSGANSNGQWFKLPASVGGLIIQTMYNSTGGASTFTQTFPIPFPSVCLAVIPTAVGVNATLHTSLPSSSTTTVSITNGAAGSGTSIVAIGY